MGTLRLGNSFVKSSITILLLLVVCVSAWAIYSPLHVHRNGQCSLNSLEHQITDEVPPVIAVPLPREQVIAEFAPALPRPIDGISIRAVVRGPPAHPSYFV